MFRCPIRLGIPRLPALTSALTLPVALLLMLADGQALRAEYVIFRNECKVSVVLQVASVVRGVLRRDQALVKPGEYTPKIPLDSDKVITVCDGRTGRVLFREPLRASKVPLAYAIVPGRNPGQVHMSQRKVNPATMPKGTSTTMPAVMPGSP